MNDLTPAPGAGGQATVVFASLTDVLRDQEERFQRGELVPTEDYLSRMPALRNQEEAILDLIYHEIVLRERRGEAPQLADYVRRFPELTKALRAQFAVDRALAAGDAGHFQSQSDATLPMQRAAGSLPAIAGYEVLGILGQGGMGVVYQARQTELKRLVALKMMKAGTLAQALELTRFRREAEAVARLQHPNIVQIFEIGAEQGAPYLALEYVDGGNLDQKLNRTPLPPHAAAALLETLARTMHYAHQNGVVHRDLKPANILLAGGPETPLEQATPKITDFGLAKQLGQEAGQTQSGALMGTPSYMAPEQADGRSNDIGPATDVYALGAMLYEFLTGRPPFKAATPLATARQVITTEPVPPRRLNPQAPRDLETICLKCLAKEQSKRYTSAAALADDARRFLAGQPILARRASVAERLVKWARRNPARAALWCLSAALLVVISGSGYWWERQRSATAAAVHAALLEATELHTKARAANNDLLLWSQAVSALKKAQAVAASGQGVRDLLDQVESTLASAENEQRQAQSRAAQDVRHRQMLARLEASRLPELDRDGDDRLIHLFLKAAGGYRASFQEWALDVDRLEIEEAVRRIQSYPNQVALALAGGLDQWVQSEWSGYWTELEADFRQGRVWNLVPVIGGDKNPGLATRLLVWRHRLTVAQRVDPDPLRNQLRDAVMRLNFVQFRQLVQAADPAVLPSDTTQIMAVILQTLGERKQAVSLLRRAAAAHPDDYFLRCLLGHYCTALVPADWNESVQHMTAASALRPNDAWPLLQLGFALLKLHRDDEALLVYRRLLQLQPNNHVAHYSLALLSHQLGDLPGAIAHGREAVRLKQANALFHRMLGQTLEAANDPAGAEVEYLAAVQNKPGDALAHWLYGGILQKQNKHAKAAAAFESACAVQPKESRNWLALADARRRLCQRDEAIAAYQKAIQTGAAGAPVHFSLGCLLFEKGPPANSVAELREAVRLQPNLHEAHAFLGKALATTGAAGEIIDAGRALLKHWPDDAETNERLAKALRQKGDEQSHQSDWDGAIVSYRESLACQPDSFAFRYMGQALWYRGRLAEAAEAFQQAVKLPGADAETWRVLGLACQRLGRLDEALAAFQQAVKASPKSAAAQHGLGSCLLQRGDLKGAAAALQESLKLAQDYTALCDYAQVLFRQKQLSGALTQARLAIKLSPDAGAAYVVLGKTLAAQGAFAEAQTALVESMRKQPSFDTGHALAELFVRRGSVPEALAYLTDRTEPLALQTALSYTGLLVLDGKTVEYRTACGALLKLYHRTLEPRDAFLVARCLVQAPAAGADPTEAVRLAERAVKADPTHPWCRNVLALAHYRAGRFDQAAESAKESLKVGAWHPSLNWLVLALAEGKLGNSKEAQRLFDQAVQAGSAGMNPQDVVYFQLLQREAASKPTLDK